MKLLTSIHTLPNTDTDSGPQLHSSSRHYRVEKERLNVETQVNLSTNHRANAPLCKSKIEKKTSAHVDVPTSTTLVSREGKGIGIPCSFQPTLVHASVHVKENIEKRHHQGLRIQAKCCLIMDVEIHTSSHPMIPVENHQLIIRLLWTQQTPKSSKRITMKRVNN